MRKASIISILILFACASLSAKAKPDSISIMDIVVERSEGKISVAFKLNVGIKAVKSVERLEITPVLRNGNDSLRLIPVVIRGRRARIAEDRYVMASGKRSFITPVLFTRNGETIEYSTTVESRQWMTGSELIINGISTGCCSSKSVTIGVIASNILHTEPKIERDTVIEVIPAKARLSTGDKLAAEYPFVAPITSYEKAEPEVYGANDNSGKHPYADAFVEANLGTTLAIHFYQGSNQVDRNLFENAETLDKLLTALKIIKESDDCRVLKVVIAGYSSPEGTQRLNERLALDRATALKNHIIENTGLRDDALDVYNGGIDWSGLRRMVSESDMTSKDEVLKIIDTVPVWDAKRKTGRRGELMKLNAGEPYRHIQADFFPRLRQAAYIKVYYENK